MFTQWSPKNDTLVELALLSDKMSKREYANTVYNTLAPHIKAVDKRLWIKDDISLGFPIFDMEYKIMPRDSISHYQFAQEMIYEAIEERLQENPEINYVRVLTLYEDNYIERLKKFVSTCPLSLFKHICHCIKHFPDQTKFYCVKLLECPSCLIDNKLLWTQENDYRLNEDEITRVPTTIRVEKLYKDAKTRLIWEQSQSAYLSAMEVEDPLTKIQLKRTLSDRYEELEEYISKERKTIDELKSGQLRTKKELEKKIQDLGKVRLISSSILSKLTFHKQFFV